MKLNLIIIICFLAISTGFSQSKNIIGVNANYVFSKSSAQGLRPEISYERVLTNKWSAFTSFSYSTTDKNTFGNFNLNLIMVDFGAKYIVFEKDKFQIKLKAGPSYQHFGKEVENGARFESKAFGIMTGAEAIYKLNNKIDAFADFKTQILKEYPNNFGTGVGLKFKFGK